MTRKHGAIAVYQQEDPTTVTKRGPGSDTLIGYVSMNSINGLVFRQESDPDSALLVDFAYPTASTMPTELSLNMENADFDPSFPLIGMIQGRDSDDDLASGNSDYGYFGGVDATTPGAPPTAGDSSWEEGTAQERDNEAAVWTYDPSTDNLLPQWINTDSSSPAMQFWTQYNGELYYGGDQEAYSTRSGQQVTIIPIFFRFEARDFTTSIAV